VDAITTAQKTTVTKSSSDRLRLLLLRYGYAEEVVLGWARKEIMNKYAELLAQGIEPPGAVRAVDPEAEKQRMAHEKELKQMKMQLEMQKIAQEQELEKQKIAQEQELQKHKLLHEQEVETQKIEYEQQLEKQKLVQEQHRLEQEEYKLKMQDRLEMEQLSLEREKLKQEEELKATELKNKPTEDSDETKMLKRYGDALAQVISSQPEEPTDLPAYFRGVKVQFANLNVPVKYQARLIFKYLTPRARALCFRLDSTKLYSYKNVKDAVMKEYGLIAKTFLTRFNNLRKENYVTCILFASKLEGLLRQYLESRKTKDFETLVSLIISDRIKIFSVRSVSKIGVICRE